LPPSIVLEVLQVLEAEIHLREDTRVAEQAKAATPKEQHAQQAKALSKNQDKLRDRIDKVVERIRELPEGDAKFAKEIGLLKAVSIVMNDATDILAKADTGSPAIAAETEAIELLLQSKRFNPNGGGGGGANPGGGGGGTTHDSAMALIGKGVNEKEVREAPRTTQATGETGSQLPEEYRSGLDTYFNRLEKK
jgi:predicted transcriptional regulator